MYCRLHEPSADHSLSRVDGSWSAPRAPSKQDRFGKSAVKNLVGLSASSSSARSAAVRSCIASGGEKSRGQPDRHGHESRQPLDTQPGLHSKCHGSTSPIESPVPAYATPRRAETKDASPCSSSRRRRHLRSRSASPPRRRHESPRRRDNALVQSALAYWGNLWANFQDANLDELFEFEARHFERFDPDVEEHTHDHHATIGATATCANGPSSGLKTASRATPRLCCLRRDVRTAMPSGARSLHMAFLAVVCEARRHAPPSRRPCARRRSRRAMARRARRHAFYEAHGRGAQGRRLRGARRPRRCASGCSLAAAAAVVRRAAASRAASAAGLKSDPLSLPAVPARVVSRLSTRRSRDSAARAHTRATRRRRPRTGDA